MFTIVFLSCLEISAYDGEVYAAPPSTFSHVMAEAYIVQVHKFTQKGQVLKEPDPFTTIKYYYIYPLSFASDCHTSSCFLRSYSIWRKSYLHQMSPSL